MAEEILLTEEGYNKLKDELYHLIHVRRPDVQEKIGEAKSFGDLSENSEYEAARDEQREVEEKIHELENTLKKAKIISKDEVSNDKVAIGNKVMVYDLTFEEECVYSIVSDSESDPMNGLISDESPIGKALIGAKVGDIVNAEAPESIVEMKIISIS